MRGRSSSSWHPGSPPPRSTSSGRGARAWISIRRRCASAMRSRGSRRSTATRGAHCRRASARCANTTMRSIAPTSARRQVFRRNEANRRRCAGAWAATASARPAWPACLSRSRATRGLARRLRGSARSLPRVERPCPAPDRRGWLGASTKRTQPQRPRGSPIARRRWPADARMSARALAILAERSQQARLHPCGFSAKRSQRAGHHSVGHVGRTKPTGKSRGLPAPARIHVMRFASGVGRQAAISPDLQATL